MAITESWWREMGGSGYLPLITIKRFMVKKALAPDLEAAESILERYLGKLQQLEYS